MHAMQRERPLIAAFVALGLLSAFNSLGIAHYLYWQFWWYDLAAHFLGGLSAGLGVVWLLSLRGGTYSFALSLVAILAVGVLWEGLESYFKFPYFPLGAWDTVQDLLFDMIGGLAGIRYARFLMGA